LPTDGKATTSGPPSDVADRIRELVEKSRGPVGKDDDPDRAGTLSDRLRALTEKISDPSQPIDLSRHDEIVRQAEERNRERLDRERLDREQAKDRDGLGR
jgi:TolA-binding protein